MPSRVHQSSAGYSGFRQRMNTILMTSFQVAVSAACLLIAGCHWPSNVETVELQIVVDSFEGSDPGWPNIYGPNHNSTSTQKNISTDWPAAGPVRKWTRPSGAGYSAPVSAGDDTVTIFRQDNEEVVECLDTESGNLKWEYRYPTEFKSTYQYSDGPYSSPVITDQSVITIGAVGQLNCLSRDSGDVQWSRDLFREYEITKRDWPFAGSPLVLEDRLILNLGAVEKEAGIIAINLSRWSNHLGSHQRRLRTHHANDRHHSWTAVGLRHDVRRTGLSGSRRRRRALADCSSST